MLDVDGAAQLLQRMTLEELALGVGGWLKLVDGGELGVRTPGDKRFLAALEAAALVLESAGQPVDRTRSV